MDILGLKIGEVARQADVPIDTIRYYERVGIIPEPPRRPSGYRAYPADTPRRVRFIRRAQELGFSLREIGELLSLRLGDDSGCADVRAAAMRRLKKIDQKIRQLNAIRSVLSDLAQACPGEGPTSECPILEAMDSK